MKSVAKLSTLGALALAGCATVEDNSGSSSLAGTAWRLVAFQSSDDSQGTTRPSSGRIYTLDFGWDGRATLQLDCNRGSANFSESNVSSTGGSLTFGTVASTRALCPPPDLADMLAARLPDVTTYSLRGGHLYLALKLDAGIFEFEPR